MTKLEPPNVVMVDLLAVSCSRYSSGQSPALFYTRFENGRVVGIQRARRLVGRFLKFRDLRQEVASFFNEALRQVKEDGYGEVRFEEVVLDEAAGVLKVDIRLPRPACENNARLSKEGSCRCYLWLWRGILNGMISEVGWAIMTYKAARVTSPAEYLNLDARKVWEAKTRATVWERRFYSVISVQAVMGR